MKAHSTYTKPVAPVVYALSTVADDKVPGGERIERGTVRRDIVGTHITYVIRNRMGTELIVDADSIDCLLAVLHQVRAEGQL